MFHTNAFILGFLPVCVAGFFALGRLYGATTRATLANCVQFVLLRVVEPGACASAGCLSSGKLCDCLEAAALRCGTRVAGRRSRRQSRPPRLVQIRRFPAAHRSPGRAGAAHYPAAGDQLLYLSANHVPGRHGTRGRCGVAPLYPLRRLRHLLSASHSRSNRAARQDHPAAYPARDDPPAAATTWPTAR